MKLMKLLTRKTQESARLPTLASPVCHLVGPGKLSVDKGRICFWSGDTRQVILDPDTLRTILCHGQVSLSSDVCILLAKKQVSVLLMNRAGGEGVGRLEPAAGPRVLLRILQYYSLCRPQTRHTLARMHVGNKIRSQMPAAHHYQRQGKDSTPTLESLQKQLDAAETCADIDKLRGIEGAASAIWFALFARMIANQWNFKRRQRRPPPDPVNSLLSLGYTLLMNRVRIALEAEGYELALGSLHSFRPGRPSLACDVMEPLRTPAVDRWVLRLCNQKHVAPDDFMPDPQRPGGMILTREAFPKVLLSFDEHWHNEHFDLHINQVAKELREILRKDMPSWPKLIYWLERGYGENLDKFACTAPQAPKEESSGNDANDDLTETYRDAVAHAEDLDDELEAEK